MHLIGIGASAGGLEALQSLLGSLGCGGNVAYVVAQHLAPDHSSLMVDLLARVTPLQVLKAVDGAELLPDTITVCPPNHDIRVQGNQLALVDPEPRLGPSPSIDRLFESIAEHWAERGAAVVLSGTGSDGARGLRAVRAAGGLTIAQAPESARFDGMPRAAIAMGGADLILDPAAIGQHLGDLMHSGDDWVEHKLPEPEALSLSSALELLKHNSGIDFSQYKDSTLQRQLSRRMALRQMDTMEEYLRLLSADRNESSALVQNLLVTVTSFFRDPESFAALGELLRTYVSQRTRRDRLRVWVPGCATGEEVYSIGMLISEVLDHPKDLIHQLKIFGTDLDEGSLALARRATYPAETVMAIPEALRERFVIPHNGEMQISEALRNCVVFARHNVGVDPPFPRLDLICSRNTLIYFTQPLQDRVLGLFRFGLQPSGLLFLGRTESLGRKTQGFGVASAEHRIFYRTTENQPSRFSTFPQPALRPPQLFSPVGRISVLNESVVEEHVATLEALVRSTCPAGVVLDEAHELVEVIGDVSPYCRLPEGRISSAATTFLLPDLQAEARALLLIVRSDGQAVRSQVLHLPAFNLRLEARPLPVNERLLTLLSFLPEPAEGPEPATTGAPVTRAADFDQQIARLEQELLTSHDTLRRSMADLEGANEELEASAEELQASSEELQSSNEELESSNEELQATNQELAVLNQQLLARTEDLQLLSSDLENIQRSLNQGMVIVDRDLRITRYTPLAVRVFALVDGDIGQPLLGIPTTVALPGLRAALGEVLAGASRRSIEAVNEEVAYLAQVLPYQEQEGQRRGAIITLTDVSELLALRMAAEASLDSFSSLTDALDEAVWKRDDTLHRLLYASKRILPLTGWTPTELFAHSELLDDAIDPADRERVWASRNLKQGGWSVEYRILRRDGQRRWVKENARVLTEATDRYVVGTLADVTEQRQVDKHGQDLSALFETLIHSPSFALAVIDADQRVVMVNGSLCERVGFDQASLVGSPASLFCKLPEAVWASQGSDTSAAEPLLRSETLTLRHRDGRALEAVAELWRLPASVGIGVLLVVLPSPQS
ncbi:MULTISPECIES: chemotaxis protein CheB [unclassified Cyanobium]|uniref:chemotaxis protein CheB n=1 Tax=unclassified Cyanobium TaxID=2627006 RepID=UPI0020CDA70E|nr:MULTISPECIES: chemotaxis protein CheB [unclassified Cyanobium]MCP9858271.1 PAS domain S-box protein [Cyanobium sp. Cruz-8H5]MCP9865652.1 PAS domain S-box protein [Cyanobium sp. Cruz-8D1]